MRVDVYTLGGYTLGMSTAIQNRLRRVIGQLERLEAQIAAGTDCTEVIPQFLAVKGAIGSALESYMSEALSSCSSTDEVKMKRLVRMLTRL